MPEIVIFPCGAGEPAAHYRATVVPPSGGVDLEAYADELGQDLLSRLRERLPDVTPPLWGSRPPKRSVWDGVQRGDVAFFYRDRHIISWTTIVDTFRSEALAEALWQRHARGDTWEYIYVLGEIHRLDPPGIPFSRLTEAAGYDMEHPLGTMIVRQGNNRETLRAVLGDATPAPVPRTAAEGSEWSQVERATAVQDYLEMLRHELNGEPYSKADHRRALAERLPGRSEGSIEYMHGNISAVLDEMGLPRIPGYVPASNFASGTRAAVEEALGNDRSTRQLLSRERARREVEEEEEETASLLANPRRPLSQGFIRDTRRKRAIEMHAVEKAKAHYRSLGYAVKDVGSTESYDLLCVRDDDELHVEVKGTTTAGEFVHLTKNEVAHAREFPDVALYVLTGVTVSGDGKQVEASGGTPQIYDPWELDAGALLPTMYRYGLPEST